MGLLAFSREIGKADQLPLFPRAADGEHLWSEGIPGGHACVRTEAGLVPAQLFHLLQSVPYLLLHGAGDGAQRRVLPVKRASVQISAVLCGIRIFLIAVIIHLADLIAAGKHEKALQAHAGRVHQQVPSDAGSHLFLIPLETALLDAAEACRGTAAPGVPADRVEVIEFSSRKASREGTFIEAVEILLVKQRIDHQPLFLFLVQSPADIVMAAQIIDKIAVVRQAVDHIHLMLQKPGVLGGKRGPEIDHAGNAVKHVALRMLRRPKIGGKLLRGHDHLSLQDHGRADHLQHHAQHAHDPVDLRKVPAAGPKLLPDIGDRVDAEDLHAQVGKEQDVRRHLVEHDGILIVQIPLIGVKGGQHIFFHLLAPGKIARRGGGKYLRHGLLKLRGNIIGIVALIPVLIFLLPGLRPHRPLMGVRRVVHHHVQAEADPPLPQLSREDRKLTVGPDLRIHRAEVLHRVAAVIHGVRHLQKGHQMQIGDLLLRQVIQLLRKPLQPAREQLRIHGDPKHPALPVPVRRLLPLSVQLLQRRGALRVKFPHALHEPSVSRLVVIKLFVDPVKLRFMARKALRKKSCSGHSFSSPSFICLFSSSLTFFSPSTGMQKVTSVLSPSMLWMFRPYSSP